MPLICLIVFLCKFSSFRCLDSFECWIVALYTFVLSPFYKLLLDATSFTKKVIDIDEYKDRYVWICLFYWGLWLILHKFQTFKQLCTQFYFLYVCFFLLCHSLVLCTAKESFLSAFIITLSVFRSLMFEQWSGLLCYALLYLIWWILFSSVSLITH